jgi:hypothetical protein
VVAFSTWQEHQTDLIRKAKNGSVFIAASTVDVPTAITSGATAALVALPAGYEDLGLTTEDGPTFGREVEESTIRSFGHTEPTRSDVISDTTTVQVVAQETKLLTLGLYTGADVSALTADATTGEVSISKPQTPETLHYRLMAVYVDQYEGDDIYYARILPRAKVTSYGEQQFNQGDGAFIGYDLTWTGFYDSTLGYSERWVFGGPGWLALLTEMSIPQAS